MRSCDVIMMILMKCKVKAEKGRFCQVKLLWSVDKSLVHIKSLEIFGGWCGVYRQGRKG